MDSQNQQFVTASAQQHVIKINKTQPLPAKPKRLMLLHGAGVGGELTWTFVAHYLTYWDEVYIPDLAGMGKAYFHAHTPASLDSYVQQLDELVQYYQLSVHDFDLAGYSFGGMVLERWLRNRDYQGRVFLLEPAMLFSGDGEQIVTKAQHYQEVADKLSLDGQNLSAYRLFLQSVSPQQESELNEALTIQRLQENPLGFAQSLHAITQALTQDCDYYTAWRAPWRGASFVGGLSWPVMHQRHKRLVAESAAWHYEVVANANHSLVFTRPRSIAKVMNIVAERSDILSI